MQLYRLAKIQNPDLALFQERTLSDFAYFGFLLRGNTKSAIAMFQLVVETYPQSSNAYARLAESYEKNGQTELAVQHYKRTLELDPNNKQAAQKVKTLGTN